MARDVEKSALLYFFDQESGIFTGEVGTAGDSNDFTLPSGMTEKAPPPFSSNQQAVFDINLKTWSVEYINPYDGLTQPEKDVWDAAIAKQSSIDAAQDKIIGRVTEAVDLVLAFIDTIHSEDLLPAWKTKLDSIRADYATWENLNNGE